MTELNSHLAALRPELIVAPVASPSATPIVPPCLAIAVPESNYPSGLAKSQSADKELAGKVDILWLGRY